MVDRTPLGLRRLRGSFRYHSVPSLAATTAWGCGRVRHNDKYELYEYMYCLINRIQVYFLLHVYNFPCSMAALLTRAGSAIAHFPAFVPLAKGMYTTPKDWYSQSPYKGT
jgi:hypothetical protein